MKHAGAAALDRLEELLVSIRGVGGLTERSRGVFWRRSRAFLHFHEDPSGLYADIRGADGDDFDRVKVDDLAGRADLLARVRASG